MFSVPFKPDDKVEEGFVLSVDPIGNTCQVRTIRGRTLNAVRWLIPVGGTGRGGMHAAPNLEDRVLVSFATGSPIIQGCLASVTSTLVPAVSIGTGSISNTGDQSQINGSVSNTGKPPDSVPGDHIITTQGGGLLALFKTGGIFMKAGGLAQIFLSRLDGLVRIFSRNLYMYSDAHTEANVNAKDKVYQYRGFAQNVAATRAEAYTYEEVYGNTAAGWVGKSSRDPQVLASLPVTNATIRLVKCGNLTETVATNGNYMRNISATTVSQNATDWQTQTGNDILIRIDPGKVFVKFQGKTITLDGSGLTAVSDGPLTLQSGGAMTLSAGGGLTMSAASVSMSGGGCTMNSTGGTFSVNASAYDFQ